MSVLRTPRVDQLPQPNSDNEEHRPAAQQRPLTMQFVLLGAGLLIAGIIGLAALLRGEPDPAPQPAAAPTVAPTQVRTASPEPTVTAVPPTPTPSCVSGQQQLVLIEDLERRGDWRQAANIANAALNLDCLTTADRRLLTEKAIGDGLKALMEASHRKTDTVQHQQLVDQYLALQQRAQDAGVPVIPALQFAEEAHGRSQFLLAKVAIEQALQAGEYQPQVHRDITRLYVSALYGLCHWYTTAPLGSETYQSGLAYCVASNEVADAFCTGQGEAATRLNELIGSDHRSWPTPAETPLDSYVGSGCS